MVGFWTTTLLQISCKICQKKNFENRLRFDEVTAMSLVSPFLWDTCDLHWLPVGHRITYKLCLTTWKTLNTSQPLYLSELISHYLPSRSLRSSNSNLLTRPAGITSNFSSRAFSVSAPSTWNSLLHTFVLSIPYPPLNATQNSISSSLLLPSSHPVPCASDSFSRFLALYKFVCMYVCMYVQISHLHDTVVQHCATYTSANTLTHEQWHLQSNRHWCKKPPDRITMNFNLVISKL